MEQRGLGRERYCMARFGDVGPYSTGNVYITSCADNVRDYQAELKERGVLCADGYFRLPEKSHKCDGRPRPTSGSGPGRGWTFRANRSTKNPYQVVCGKEYIGCFPTQEAAEAAYRAAHEAKYGTT